MGLEFPAPWLIHELRKKGKLGYTLDGFADILAARVSSPRPWDPHGADRELLFILRGYLRIARTEKDVQAHTALEKVAYELCVHRRAVVDSPVETVWDLVCVFGPKNSTSVIAYLDSLPKLFSKKLGRLIDSLAHQDHVEEQSKYALAVLFSSQLAASFANREWQNDIKKIRTDNSSLILRTCELYLLSSPVSELRQVFPQLPRVRARELLHGYDNNVDVTTQYILDNPEVIDEPHKKPRLVQLDRNQPRNTRTGTGNSNAMFEKTLELTSALSDEDPDDEPEIANEGEKSQADKAVDATEKLLFETSMTTPEVFNTDKATSNERKILRKKTGWTDRQLEAWYQGICHDMLEQSKLARRYGFGYGAGRQANQAVAPPQSTKRKKNIKPHQQQQQQQRQQSKPSSSKAAGGKSRNQNSKPLRKQKATKPT